MSTHNNTVDASVNIKLYTLLNLKEINKNNISSGKLVHCEMPTEKPVSLEEYKFKVVSWISELAPQSMIDESLRLIVFSVVILRKKRISRAYIAKSLGINKSTVSEHNTLLSVNGLIDVEHFYRKNGLNEINGYGHKFIMALAGLFGYVNPMEWEKATLTNYLFNKTSLITKIAMLIELGSECFPITSKQENENPLETSRKARLWDEIVGSSPTTAH